MKNNGRILTLGLSVLAGLIILLMIFSIGQRKRAQQPFGLGDYSSADVENLVENFNQSGSNSDLVVLLGALCYKAKMEEDESVIPSIQSYGTELFDRARNETADLQTLDTEERMLELIGLLKQFGAK